VAILFVFILSGERRLHRLVRWFFSFSVRFANTTSYRSQVPEGFQSLVGIVHG
jgi:hypothetical protein